MTLDEAIKHAEEVADKKEREKQKWEKWLETDSDFRAITEKVSCELCAKEHRQLAEWLIDYKRLLEQEPSETIHGSTYGGVSWGGTYKPQEPCEDAISRQAVLNTLDNADKFMDEDRTVETYKALLKECYEVLPSVNPRPKTGHWKRAIGENGVTSALCCSECGFEDNRYEMFDYCPKCGCKMEKLA